MDGAPRHHPRSWREQLTRPFRLLRRRPPALGLRRRRLVSPLTRRILAVNIIALLIPVGGLLYQGPYRDGLVDAELESLRTQGEIISGALGEGAIALTITGQQYIELARARHIIRRVSAPTRVRARLFLPSGEMVADSRRLPGTMSSVQVEVLPIVPPDRPAFDWILAPLDWLAGLIAAQPHYDYYEEKPAQRAEQFPEVLHALSGDIIGVARYATEKRDGRLILTVALPIQRYRQVTGALLLSKESTEIDSAIRNVRQVVLALFGGALVFTILVSFYLAGTIVHPIKRLAVAAERVRHGFGRDTQQIPDFTERGDEIGDLSGALREMTDALHQRMEAIERFAADVSHEIKNPLTSLRSAVETAARIKDPGQQAQLMAIILQDVQRLNRLITDISDASRLDAELSRAQSGPVSIARMLDALADLHRTTATDGSPRLTVEIDGSANEDLPVTGLEDRLVQVFRNLIANAVSFSPPGGTIAIHGSRSGKVVEVTIEDEGPGLPAGKLEAIFDRFYSERPKAEKFGMHSGLGLSISKQIVEAHGGSIRAENRTDEDGNVRGARFVVRLPAA